MRTLLAIILASLSFSTFAVEKKVCYDTVKKGKTVQECRTIKIHKKLEGTAVPEKKKK